MKNNIKKFFDFYKRKSIAVKTFKRLYANFKSLSTFYKILYVLGIIMPFVLFAGQCFLDFLISPTGIEHFMEQGIIYLLKYEKYFLYKVIHPELALLVNLIALLRDEYNIKIIIIDIIMFCCASYIIFLLVISMVFHISGGF